jgi:4-oxalocrotonate tautomerase
MPVVIVEWYEGRTVEQKKQVIEGITGVMTKIGVPTEATQVIIHDVPKTDWGAAGKPAAER